MFIEDLEYDFELEKNNEGNVNDDIDQGNPINAEHTMTVGVNMLLILIYSNSHGISGIQLNDLLTLIGLHCVKIHPGP